MLILHDTMSVVICLDSSKTHHKSEEFVAVIKIMITNITKEWGEKMCGTFYAKSTVRFTCTFLFDIIFPVLFLGSYITRVGSV